MSVPTGASMAGNSSRLANALRSAADGVAAEDATSAIASPRPVSQTVLGSTGGWDRPIVFRSTTVNNPHVQTGSPHRRRKPAAAVTLPRGRPAADGLAGLWEARRRVWDLWLGVALDL